MEIYPCLIIQLNMRPGFLPTEISHRCETIYTSAYNQSQISDTHIFANSLTSRYPVAVWKIKMKESATLLPFPLN